MRVLFAVWPSRSHLYPMVPLAWACRAAGHEVRVASMAGLAPAVTATGLTAVPVGGDGTNLTAMAKNGGLAAWHRQERWPADWPTRIPDLSIDQRVLLDGLGTKSARVSGLMAPDMIAFARQWRPDLIVYDAVSFSGKVAGDVLGVPTVSHLWGQVGIHRNELAADGGPHPDFVALMQRFGVTPCTEPTMWIDPCPPSLRMPADIDRVAVRYVAYNGVGGVPDWLQEPPRGPRICVTWGLTSPALHGPALPELILATIRRIATDGVEVVVAAPVDRDRLGSLPDTVRTTRLLPLQLLLPTCRAIMHQGGAGTSMTAVSYGVPHLVVSMRPEHMATGARLAALGAGIHRVHNELSDDESDSALLAADLSRLLDEPSYPAAAARLQADLRAQPSPASLVERLEQLVAQRRVHA